MNLNRMNSTVPAVIARRRFRRGHTLAAAGIGLLGSVIFAGGAFAQTAGNGIGAQLQTMAQEGSTTGGFVASTLMYCAALICFIGGVWSLWQSRQPQNRESGRVALGLSGLVLCGLFVTGGSWINKAAQTTTGSAATVMATARCGHGGRRLGSGAFLARLPSSPRSPGSGRGQAGDLGCP